jgi:two-component system copper resistance phosphate regulon response regulator CusR
MGSFLCCAEWWADRGRKVKFTSMKILVIEDEPKVASFIKRGLEELSFKVDVAYDSFIGEKLAMSRKYDVILLDIIIPGKNGIDLCRQLKNQHPQVPVLMLTALGTTEDKVSGFEAGADDYLLKPFEFAELVVRIKALTRRSKAGNLSGSHILEFSDLKLDLEKKLAIRSGTVIHLTAKEFLLLEYFIRNRERVISRPELAEKIWDVTFDTGTNVVEVYINILRKKIDRDFEPKLLHTRIGLGYILSEEV